jgi:DNA-binding transcriptional LysR family regulator
MEFADLRVFEAVARHGSMSRAALELNTVQSNVTARVRQMEARLGVPLFTRGGRGVRLAAAGERLLPYARRILKLQQEARVAALDDGTPAGPLRIGSLETTAAVRLAPVLGRFSRESPMVDLAIRTGTTCELLAEVLQYRLDGAFVCGPVAYSELESVRVCSEELVLLSAPGTDGLRTLADGGPSLRVVVLRTGCSYRQRLEDFLARRGLPASRTTEFGTLEAIFSAVEAGYGVTLLPRSLVGPVVAAGRLAVNPLPAGQGRVETVFVRRTDAERSRGMDRLVEMVCDRAREAPGPSIGLASVA